MPVTAAARRYCAATIVANVGAVTAVTGVWARAAAAWAIVRADAAALFSLGLWRFLL